MNFTIDQYEAHDNLKEDLERLRDGEAEFWDRHDFEAMLDQLAILIEEK